MKTLGPALCFVACAGLFVLPDAGFFTALCGFVGMFFFGLSVVVAIMEG